MISGPRTSNSPTSAILASSPGNTCRRSRAAHLADGSRWQHSSVRTCPRARRSGCRCRRKTPASPSESAPHPTPPTSADQSRFECVTWTTPSRRPWPIRPPGHRRWVHQPPGRPRVWQPAGRGAHHQRSPCGSGAQAAVARLKATLPRKRGDPHLGPFHGANSIPRRASRPDRHRSTPSARRHRRRLLRRC
jgi:hypothetical protein